ncbi:hypothetical protein LWC34_15535 [Kibdelosporangium philippinense]|uniref:Uncharacterized protein n=1 Tax=Kibdelosporangium philippinense TaxID=211113 RepID=A0ABS8Z9Z0_9PSEU|nr:hypothetical protein [Kibdelosporangium philippinense]MCE7004237.1 hypothetical protein [Kibdelosporangium philippinense]
MRKTAIKIASTLAVAGAMTAALQAPAAASELPKGLNFWSGVLTGVEKNYAAVPAGCTAIPFGAGSVSNQTPTDIYVFETSDCSGVKRAYPSTELRSFNFVGKSFKAA